MNGQYGPYIRYDNKTNYKIILDKNLDDKQIQEYLEKLTIKDCNTIISESKNKKTKTSKKNITTETSDNSKKSSNTTKKKNTTTKTKKTTENKKKK
jgi:topoisomerase IA-like protein